MKKTFFKVAISTLFIPFLGWSQTNLVLTSPNSTTPSLYNILIGVNSGNQLIIGTQNTFLGHFSGSATTTGTSNIFMGYKAGYRNTSGGPNTFIGTETGYNNTTGTYNSFLGFYAGRDNATGSQNTFIGTFSGYNTTTGNYNAFMGVYAGQNNTTGQQNTLLGYQADVRSGNLTNASAIGANAKVSVSNAIVLGDTAQNTKVGIGTTYPQFPLDVKGIINIRGNGTLKFSHLTNPSYQNGQTDQFLTVNANGETVLAKISKLDEVTELKAQVAELTKQLLELKQRMEQLERGGKLIAEK